MAFACPDVVEAETVERIVDTLQKIDRSNFGLIYEPANLQLCGQDYGYQTTKSIRCDRGKRDLHRWSGAGSRDPGGH